MNWKPALFAVPLAAALVACPDTKPTPTADFIIANAAPASLTFTKLASGDPAPQTVTVTITPANGFTDAVTLSLVAPTSPASSGVTGTGTIAATSTSGTLTVTATNAANVGDNQQYVIQATSGAITKTIALPITVNPVATKPTELKIVTTSESDGFIFKEKDGTTYSPFPTNASNTIRIGNDAGAIGRGFVSFDLSALPATVTAAKIVSVNLMMYQQSVEPTNCDPYVKFTNATDKLVVEAITFNGTLNKAAFEAPILSKIGNLSTTNILESKTLDVTAAVKDDVTNKTVRGSFSRFRLRFPVEDSTATDTCTVRFTDALGATAANRPTLVILYTP